MNATKQIYIGMGTFQTRSYNISSGIILLENLILCRIRDCQVYVEISPQEIVVFIFLCDAFWHILDIMTKTKPVLITVDNLIRLPKLSFFGKPLEGGPKVIFQTIQTFL